MMYNYKEAMLEDIREAAEYIDLDGMTAEDAETTLNEELWISDSVTGNASGSYTFNRWRAEQYVKDNLNLAAEAFQWCEDLDALGRHLLNEDFEYIDVTIRCYLFSPVLSKYISEEQEAGRFED